MSVVRFFLNDMVSNVLKMSNGYVIMVTDVPLDFFPMVFHDLAWRCVKRRRTFKTIQDRPDILDKCVTKKILLSPNECLGHLRHS